MADAQKATTLGELRKSGHRVLPVREEIRRNLMARMRDGAALFPGVMGYEDTVIPQVENAVLAGQDIIFLGERGQAKSRIIRSLVGFLDEETPVVRGCEINDNPYAPICLGCRTRLAEEGDGLEIDWLPRDQRYAEKLATPDISVADLIGEIDPIKVAEGRYLSDELTIHFGLIPRANRGIFCINELPDLAERIQVGLFNLMEERDIQIRGHRVRLPLDIYVVASANPEDYTNRGRIITPLKDRYGALIRTHYPKTVEEEVSIVDQERSRFADTEEAVVVPDFMAEIIGEFTSLARRSADINQRSGVSVRVSIANYETLAACALRRAIRYNETQAVPRVSDLPFIVASTLGKLELETVEDGREARVVDELTKKAVLNVFNRHFDANDFVELQLRFEEGLEVEAGSEVPSFAYAERLGGEGGLAPMVQQFGIDPRKQEALFASGAEFVLDGLHLNRKLNRDRIEGKFRYRT
ncbi:MAG: sigma 54-interacting transcriptional regulator [Chloroflexi bacterium]|nr:sigma 54-interacting transcriptional regulator [Chloroflexota bacterium]